MVIDILAHIHVIDLVPGHIKALEREIEQGFILIEITMGIGIIGVISMVLILTYVQCIEKVFVREIV